jgi:hypothetical protein
VVYCLQLKNLAVEIVGDDVPIRGTYRNSFLLSFNFRLNYEDITVFD